MNKSLHLQYWTLNLHIPVIHIDIDCNIRKSTLLGVSLVLIAVAIPILAVLKVIEMGLLLGCLGFVLAFTGGIFILVDIGEIN